MAHAADDQFKDHVNRTTRSLMLFRKRKRTTSDCRKGILEERNNPATSRDVSAKTKRKRRNENTVTKSPISKWRRIKKSRETTQNKELRNPKNKCEFIPELRNGEVVNPCRMITSKTGTSNESKLINYQEINKNGKESNKSGENKRISGNFNNEYFNGKNKTSEHSHTKKRVQIKEDCKKNEERQVSEKPKKRKIDDNEYSQCKNIKREKNKINGNKSGTTTILIERKSNVKSVPESKPNEKVINIIVSPGKYKQANAKLKENTLNQIFNESSGEIPNISTSSKDSEIKSNDTRKASDGETNSPKMNKQTSTEELKEEISSTFKNINNYEDSNSSNQERSDGDSKPNPKSILKTSLPEKQLDCVSKNTSPTSENYPKNPTEIPKTEDILKTTNFYLYGSYSESSEDLATTSTDPALSNEMKSSNNKNKDVDNLERISMDSELSLGMSTHNKWSPKPPRLPLSLAEKHNSRDEDTISRLFLTMKKLMDLYEENEKNQKQKATQATSPHICGVLPPEIASRSSKRLQNDDIAKGSDANVTSASSDLPFTKRMKVLLPGASNTPSHDALTTSAEPPSTSSEISVGSQRRSRLRSRKATPLEVAQIKDKKIISKYFKFRQSKGRSKKYRKKIILSSGEKWLADELNSHTTRLSRDVSSSTSSPEHKPQPLSMKSQSSPETKLSRRPDLYFRPDVRYSSKGCKKRGFPSKSGCCSNSHEFQIKSVTVSESALNSENDRESFPHTPNENESSLTTKPTHSFNWKKRKGNRCISDLDSGSNLSQKQELVSSSISNSSLMCEIKEYLLAKQRESKLKLNSHSFCLPDEGTSTSGRNLTSSNIMLGLGTYTRKNSQKTNTVHLESSSPVSSDQRIRTALDYGKRDSSQKKEGSRKTVQNELKFISENESTLERILFPSQTNMSLQCDSFPLDIPSGKQLQERCRPHSRTSQAEQKGDSKNSSELDSSSLLYEKPNHTKGRSTSRTKEISKPRTPSPSQSISSINRSYQDPLQNALPETSDPKAEKMRFRICINRKRSAREKKVCSRNSASRRGLEGATSQSSKWNNLSGQIYDSSESQSGSSKFPFVSVGAPCGSGLENDSEKEITANNLCYDSEKSRSHSTSPPNSQTNPSREEHKSPFGDLHEIELHFPQVLPKQFHPPKTPPCLLKKPEDTTSTPKISQDRASEESIEPDPLEWRERVVTAGQKRRGPYFTLLPFAPGSRMARMARNRNSLPPASSTPGPFTKCCSGPCSLNPARRRRWSHSTQNTSSGTFVGGGYPEPWALYMSTSGGATALWPAGPLSGGEVPEVPFADTGTDGGGCCCGEKDLKPEKPILQVIVSGHALASLTTDEPMEASPPEVPAVQADRQRESPIAEPGAVSSTAPSNALPSAPPREAWAWRALRIIDSWISPRPRTIRAPAPRRQQSAPANSRPPLREEETEERPWSARSNGSWWQRLKSAIRCAKAKTGSRRSRDRNN